MKKNKVAKYLLITFQVMATSALLSPAILHLFFKKKAMQPFPFPQNKIFGHRSSEIGETDKIMKYISAGYGGIELDIFFDQKLGQFILGHDQNTLALRGTQTSLEALFVKMSALGIDLKQLYLWLDFKNLTLQNAAAASGRVIELVQKFALKDLLFVESQNPQALNILAHKGIPCVLWITPYSRSRIFYVRNLWNMYWVLRGQFIALSMPHEHYRPQIKNLFKHLPILLFTINDLKERTHLMQSQEIKILLTDDIKK